MKVLVTGSKGQLGVDLTKELAKRGHEVIGVDVAEMDITNFSQVDEVITSVCPDAVIHCAAWTAVDLAEDEENIPKVKAINAYGTENVAKASSKVGAKLIYISTDYVFDGNGVEPFDADSTAFGPLSVYGQSKLDGENAVRKYCDKFFVVRTAWVFGKGGNNFIKTMLNVAKKRDKVTVVCDQVGTPTYTPDLAVLLADMVVTDKYGNYHATNEGGFISWYEFCKEIYKQAGVTTEVIPVTTAEYGISKAKRPFNSRLDKSKLKKEGFTTLPDWRDALKRFLEELNKEEIL